MDVEKPFAAPSNFTFTTNQGYKEEINAIKILLFSPFRLSNVPVDATFVVGEEKAEFHDNSAILQCQHARFKKSSGRQT